MSMIGKVRRMHFRQGKSVREIARLTSLSRNTIRSWLREPEVKERQYCRPAVMTRLAPFAERLQRALSINARQQAIPFNELVALGTVPLDRLGYRLLEVQKNIWPQLCEFAHGGAAAITVYTGNGEIGCQFPARDRFQIIGNACWLATRAVVVAHCRQGRASSNLGQHIAPSTALFKQWSARRPERMRTAGVQLPVVNTTI